MAVAFRAAGTAKKVGSGNLASIGLPAGHVSNDILVCALSARDNVSATINQSYTSKLSATNGTGLRWEIYWKRDGGAEVAPTITHTGGDSAVAQIFAYSGCITSGDPFDTAGTSHTDSGSGGSGTLTANSITPFYTNSMILFFGAEGVGATDGGGANYYSAWSGTDPTFTERGDTVSNLGVGEASLGMASGLTTDGAATGTRTVSLSTLSTGTWVGLSVLLSLTDATPTGGGSAASYPLQRRSDAVLLVR